jgi:hypothetical protein
MVETFEDLSESSRPERFFDFITKGEVVAGDSFVISLLVCEV